MIVRSCVLLALLSLSRCASPSVTPDGAAAPDGRPASGGLGAAGSDDVAHGAPQSPPLEKTRTRERPVFSRDDFPASVQRAKSGGKLVFVDAWAEWCHTCLSMESVVLADPSLADFTAHYEFVALDTEKPANAEFIGRYAMDTWPTFFVIHPDDLSLVGFWPGAASVREVRGFLEQSLDAAALLQGGRPPPYLVHFLEARRAQSAGDQRRAASEYAAAYAAMPPNWPRTSELLFGYIDALASTGQFERCGEIGKKHLDHVEGAAKPAQFAQRYFTCLGQLRSAGRDAEVARALGKLERLARSPDPDMAFDDRVDALTMLATAHDVMGEKQRAEEIRSERLRLAEEGAAAAKDESEARAFDRVRVAAYVDEGRPDAALELLERRERAFPHGYATPALLAEVLRGLGRNEEGLGALRRATANSEGPRRCDYLEDEVRWLRTLGDEAGELLALERLIEERGKLRGAANEQALARARTRRDALAAPRPR